MGVAFSDSDWVTSGATTVAHSQIGSDNVVIDGNTFVGTEDITLWHGLTLMWII